jgi:CP family cyanate transporter-like MFS transporter
MMAQSLGYLFAAFGPVTFGLLHDASGSWNLPLILLSILGVILAAVGYEAGHDRTVS